MPLTTFSEVDKIASASQDNDLFQNLSSAWLMFNSIRERSGNISSSTWGENPVRGTKMGDDPETTRDDSVHETTQATQKWPALRDRWPALLTSTT